MLQSGCKYGDLRAAGFPKGMDMQVLGGALCMRFFTAVDVRCGISMLSPGGKDEQTHVSW